MISEKIVAITLNAISQLLPENKVEQFYAGVADIQLKTTRRLRTSQESLWYRRSTKSRRIMAVPLGATVVRSPHWRTTEWAGRESHIS